MKSKKSKKVTKEASNAPTEASNAPTSVPTFGEESVVAAGKAFDILADLKNNLLPCYDLLLPGFHGFLDDFILHGAKKKQQTWKLQRNYRN